MPWQVVPTDCPINPIHAALGRTGKVLFFAGSGNDPTNFQNSSQGSLIFDPTNNSFSSIIPIPKRPDGSVIDVFCAAHSWRVSGRLLVCGGTLQYDPFFGETATFAFDFTSQTWLTASSMNEGRWYPTCVTLANGKVFSISGYEVNGDLSVNPEIFSGGSVGWSLFSQTTPGAYPLYAHLFLLDNGKLFYTGAQLGGNNAVRPSVLTLPAAFNQQITAQVVNGLQQEEFGDQSASVILPPAQDQKIMIIGGASNGQATTRTAIVDFKSATPSYVTKAPLANARMHHNAVILPDRTVFVCNGSRVSEDVNQSNLAPEIYNPATNTWTVLSNDSPTINGRVYHSVALLLPDGKVLTAGGNPIRGQYQKKVEIYSPPYIAQTRPTIGTVPATIRYNQTITIQTPQAASIKWAELVRPMSTTHGLDTDQRLVDLPITARNASSVTVSVTNNANIAPPGYYMLFLVNNNNVPSVATWVLLK
jgi:hypothetical protein